jgi:hypothetical protein
LNQNESNLFKINSSKLNLEEDLYRKKLNDFKYNMIWKMSSWGNFENNKNQLEITDSNTSFNIFICSALSSFDKIDTNNSYTRNK